HPGPGRPAGETSGGLASSDQDLGGAGIRRKTMVSDDGSSECNSNFQFRFLLRFSLNRSSKAPGARQDCKRDLRRSSSSDHLVGPMSTDIQSDYSSISALDFASRVSGRSDAIEVRGIHHRASHSFRTTKGDSAEFSAEVYGKFKEKLK
ncbi:hypothetical protein Prudu_195S000100, partial [Prunus dulcis]